MPTSIWTRHHVLSLADFTSAEYNTVLQTAASFREVLSRRTKKVPTLQGQVVANLFLNRLPAPAVVLNWQLNASLLIRSTLQQQPLP